MIWSVRLPKVVAIHNSRLAFLHNFLLTSVFALLIWVKFTIGHEQYSQIPITVHMGIRWDESDTIQGMEDYFANNPVVEQACHQAPYTNYSTSERWGYVWPRHVACTRMCNLHAVIDHSIWDAHWKMPSEADKFTDAICLGDFQSFGMHQQYTALQFMQNLGEQDVILTTSKNDWIVDHGRRSLGNHIEIVPQGKAAVLQVDYEYALHFEPEWFPFAKQNTLKSLKGNSTNAKTIILNAYKIPVHVIEPGGHIKFTVDEVVSWSTEPSLPEVISDQLINGAQFNLEMNCFGSQVDIDQHFGRDVLPDYHPTLNEPVCTLEVVVASNFHQVAVHYGIPRDTDNVAVEIVSETKGFYFKCMPGHGFASALDGNALLISITSMLVILALPRMFTSFVAARMLGPLSEMYRRTIVEPYDIERAAAAAATVLAANMSTFHTLNKPNSEVGIGLATEESTKLAAINIQMMLDEAMNSRATCSMTNKEMSNREIGSLARFVYEGIHRKPRSESLLAGFWCCDFEDENEIQNLKSVNHGITLDEWNQVRMEHEKITFDAVVKLFDKDRRRHFAELFFTPPNIRMALARAGDPSVHIPGVSVSVTPYWRRDHCSVSVSNSVPRGEGDATPQACSSTTRGSLRNEVDSEGREPVHEPMGLEVPPRNEMRRELMLITARLQAAEETLYAALGKGLLSKVTEEVPMGTDEVSHLGIPQSQIESRLLQDQNAPMLQDMVVPTRNALATPRLTGEPRREQSQTPRDMSRFTAFSVEHAQSVATRAPSSEYLESEVSARFPHSARSLCEALGAAAIEYPGSTAWCREVVLAPHTDDGARNPGAAVVAVAEQGTPHSKVRPAEQPATPQAGGDWPVAMAGSLRQAPEYTEYAGLPTTALRNVGFFHPADFGAPKSFIL